MTSSEAKQILLLYRPETDDATDPQIAEALACVDLDAELRKWLEHHQQYQGAVEKKFQEIVIPAGLKDSILAQQKVVRPEPWWQPVNLWRVAAVLVICAALAFVWARFSEQSPTPDRFADYRARMVRSALREYQMDVITNDLPQLRQWISSQGAPADFAVPGKLAGLSLTGGGVLRWRNNPVTMICYDRGDKQMLFLFVIDRKAVKDPPPENRELAKVNKLAAASWSEGEKTYILAGPQDVSLESYF